jgi:hypothetical protein
LIRNGRREEARRSIAWALQVIAGTSNFVKPHAPLREFGVLPV